MKDLKTISIDAWIAELKRLYVECPEGFTSVELAKQLGIAQATAQQRVRNGVRAGQLAFVGRRRGTGVDGRCIYSPLYRPVATKAR